MAFTDPYAAGSTRNTSEVRTELEQFTNRLRSLGATPDEVEPVVATWDDLDPDDTKPTKDNPQPWTRARRTELVSAPDAELLELINSARDEYAYATTSDDELAKASQEVKGVEAEVGASNVIGGSVAKVLEWVGDDPDRARAVLALETAEGEGGNRKTLVGPLTELLGQSAPSTPPTAVASSPDPQGPAGATTA